MKNTVEADFEDFDYDSDLSYLMRMFPGAIPVVYNNADTLLDEKLRGAYKETFFMVYRPLNTFDQDVSNFFLVLVNGANNFKLYMEGYFDRVGSRNREKFRCFGKVELLMKKDNSSLFGAYKDAVSLAFKDSDPFDGKDTPVISYLYSSQKLTKLENLFVPSDDLFWKRLLKS